MNLDAPGREMDARVAVEIFGWEWHEWQASFESGGKVRCLRHPSKFIYGVYGPADEPPIYQNALPHYSTDIAAAWQVVEQMRRAGYVSGCSDLTMDSGQEWWHWTFWDYSSKKHVDFDGYGTAPLAICLAALKVAEMRKGE